MSNHAPRSVLILWADDRSANLGVRVLAAGMAQLARSIWHEPSIDFQDFSQSESGVSLGRRSILHDLTRRNGSIKERLRPFDLILDSGAGDSFADIYGITRLGVMHYVHRVASDLGIPIVMGPQTIGPFDSRSGRWMARRSLSLMSAVIARDSVSTQHAAALGRTVDATATDVVFTLPVPEVLRTRDVLLNVSGLLWNENSHVDATAYRASISKLIVELATIGRKVTLLPHVLDNPGVDNDVAVLGQVVSAVDAEIDVLVPTDLQEARSYLASANLVVGSRMHACLNAMSVGTPSISWAYSRKFGPLMADLGWHHSVDIRTEKDPARVTMEILRREDQQALERSLSSVQASARERTERAASTLGLLTRARND